MGRAQRVGRSKAIQCARLKPRRVDDQVGQAASLHALGRAFGPGGVGRERPAWVWACDR